MLCFNCNNMNEECLNCSSPHENLSARIYEIVRNIPRGEVMTYGQIAEMLGDKRLARAVGNALHKNPDRENIPCHRVVNFKGELSKSFAFGGIEAQKRLLESEGVEVVGDKVVIVNN